MTETLGELFLDIGLEPSQYEIGLENARLQAIQAGQDIERALRVGVGRQFNVLKPRVDDSALTRLNKHYDLKEAHHARLNRYYQIAPLTPQTDLTQLDILEARLKGIRQQGRITVGVRATASQATGSNATTKADNAQLADAIGRAVAKNTGKQGFAGKAASFAANAITAPLRLPLAAASSAVQGVTFALTQELSKGLGKGLSTALESALGDKVGSSELFGKVLGEGIADGINFAVTDGLDSLPSVLGKAASSLADRFNLPSSFSKKLSKEIEKGLTEDIKNIREVGKEVGTVLEEGIGAENISKERLTVAGRQRQQQSESSPVAQEQAALELRTSTRQLLQIEKEVAATQARAKRQLLPLLKEEKQLKADLIKLEKEIAKFRNNPAKRGELGLATADYLAKQQELQSVRQERGFLSAFSPDRITKLRVRQETGTSKLDAARKEYERLISPDQVSASTSSIEDLEKEFNRLIATNKAAQQIEQVASDAKARIDKLEGQLVDVNLEIDTLSSIANPSDSQRSQLNELTLQRDSIGIGLRDSRQNLQSVSAAREAQKVAEKAFNQMRKVATELAAITDEINIVSQEEATEQNVARLTQLNGAKDQLQTIATASGNNFDRSIGQVREIRTFELVEEIDTLDRSLKRITRQLDLVDAPIKKATERLQKAKMAFDQLKPEQLPQAYEDILELTFGRKLSEEEKPQLVVDSSLQRTGELANYNTQANQIRMRPDIARAVMANQLSEQQAATVAHELTHGQQFGLGSFEGIVARERKRPLTPLAGTREDEERYKRELALYPEENRAYELDARVRGRNIGQQYTAQQSRGLGLQFRTNTSAAINAIGAEMVAIKKRLEALAKAAQDASDAFDPSGVEKAKDSTIAFLRAIKADLQAIEAAANAELIPDAATFSQKSSELQQNLLVYSKSVQKRMLVIDDYILKTEADINDALQANRDWGGELPRTADARNEQVMMASNAFVNPNNNPWDVLPEDTTSLAISSQSDLADALQRSTTPSMAERASALGQQAENMARTTVAAARQASQTIQRTTANIAALLQQVPVQPLMQGASSAAKALGMVAGTSYSILQGLESFALDVVPMGRTIKGGIQQVGLPAATFAAATHFLPGGEAAAGALTHAVGSGITPFAQSATGHLTGMATEALSGLPGFMGIQSAVTSAATGAIETAMSGLTNVAIQATTVVLGGKAIQAATTAPVKALGAATAKPKQQSLPEGAPVQMPLALPEREKVEVEQIAKEQSKPLTQSTAIARTTPAKPPQQVNRETVKETARQVGVAAGTVAGAIARTAQDAVAEAKKMEAGFSRLYQGLSNALKEGNSDLIEAYSAELKNMAERSRATIDELINNAKESGEAFGSEALTQLGGVKGRLTQRQNAANKAVNKFQQKNNLTGGSDAAFDPSVRRSVTAASQTIDRLKESVAQSIAALNEFSNDIKSLNLEKLKEIATSPTAKDLAVNTAGFAASQAAGQYGIVAELSGDLIGALVARQGINAGESAIEAFKELKEDPIFAAANALEKASMLLQRTAQQMAKTTGDDLTADLMGFAVGNTAANLPSMLADTALGQLQGVPLKGAMVASVLVPHLTAIRNQIQAVVQKGAIASGGVSESLTGETDAALDPTMARLIEQADTKQKQLLKEVDELLKHALEAAKTMEGAAQQINQAYEPVEREAQLQKQFEQAEIDAELKRLQGEDAELPDTSQLEAKVKSPSRQSIIERIFGNPENADELQQSMGQLDNIFDAVLRTGLGFAALSFIGPMFVDFARASEQAALEMQRFERILTFTSGSSAKAQATLSSLRAESKELGIDLRQSIAGQAQIQGSVRDTALEGSAGTIAKSARDASAAYGLDAQQQERVFTAFSQIASKGKVSCYDDQTEVFTDQGWVNWQDVTDKHRFLTRDFESGTIEFVIPDRLIRQPYKGLMLHISDGLVDLLVTPDHRMVVRSPNSDNTEIIKAFELGDLPYYYSTSIDGNEEILVAGGSMEWVEFEGEVYCASVKYTTLYVRRNGKRAWSGNSEELRQQLGESLPGAFQIAARSIGVTTSQLDQMLQRGEVASEDFLPKFAQQLSAESAAGVAGAANSAQASINRFNNSLFDLQASVGSGVLPVKSLGLEAAASGLDLVGQNAGIVTGVLASLGIVSFKPLLSAVGTLLTRLGLLPVITKLFSGSLSGLAAAAAPVAKQFLWITLITDLMSMANKAFNAGSKEVTDFGKSAERSFNKYLELVGKADKDTRGFMGNLKNGLSQNELPSLLEETLVGGIAKGVLGKDAGEGLARNLEQGAQRGLQAVNKFLGYDTPVITFFELDSQKLNQQAQDVLQIFNDLQIEAGGMFDGAGNPTDNLKELIDIDAQLQEIYRKRAALPLGDAQGKQALQKQEEALLAARDEAAAPIGALQEQMNAYTKGLEQTRDDLRSQIETATANRAVEAGNMSAEEFERLKNNLALTESAIDANQERIDKFNKAIGGSVDATRALVREFGMISAKLADANTELGKMTNVSKQAIADAVTAGTVTRGQAETAGVLTDQTSRQRQLENNATAISGLRGGLESQQSRDALSAVNVSDVNQIGAAELKERVSLLADGKIKQLLEDTIVPKVEELKGLEVETENIKTQIAEARSQAVEKLRDLAKSVYDFYRGIEQTAKETAINAQQIAVQANTASAQNRLRSALLGFQESFTNDFVESLVSLVETLNKPLNDAISAQQQIVAAQQQYFSQLQQAQQLQQQLPTAQQVAAIGGGSSIAPNQVSPVAFPNQNQSSPPTPTVINPPATVASTQPSSQLQPAQLTPQQQVAAFGGLNTASAQTSAQFAERGIGSATALADQTYNQQIANIQAQQAIAQQQAQIEATLQADNARFALVRAQRTIAEQGRGVTRATEDLQLRGQVESPQTQLQGQLTSLQREFEDQLRSIDGFRRGLDQTISQQVQLRERIVSGLLPEQFKQFLPEINETIRVAEAELSRLTQSTGDYQAAYEEAVQRQLEQFQREEQQNRFEAQQRISGGVVQDLQQRASLARTQGQGGVADDLEDRARLEQSNADFAAQKRELDELKRINKLTADEYRTLFQQAEARLQTTRDQIEQERKLIERENRFAEGSQLRSSRANLNQARASFARNTGDGEQAIQLEGQNRFAAVSNQLRERLKELEDLRRQNKLTEAAFSQLTAEAREFASVSFKDVAAELEQVNREQRFAAAQRSANLDAELLRARGQNSKAERLAMETSFKGQINELEQLRATGALTNNEFDRMLRKTKELERTSLSNLRNSMLPPGQLDPQRISDKLTDLGNAGDLSTVFNTAFASAQVKFNSAFGLPSFGGASNTEILTKLDEQIAATKAAAGRPNLTINSQSDIGVAGQIYGDIARSTLRGGGL